MAEKTTTSVIPHVKASSYVDEQVDLFDGFGISWNGDEAVHLTFGRNSINVKNTVFFTENGLPDKESGDVEIFRLDVAALTIPLEVAKELVETLGKLIAQAEGRRSKNG